MRGTINAFRSCECVSDYNFYFFCSNLDHRICFSFLQTIECIVAAKVTPMSYKMNAICIRNDAKCAKAMDAMLMTEPKNPHWLVSIAMERKTVHMAKCPLQWSPNRVAIKFFSHKLNRVTSNERQQAYVEVAHWTLTTTIDGAKATKIACCAMRINAIEKMLTSSIAMNAVDPFVRPLKIKAHRTFVWVFSAEQKLDATQMSKVNWTSKYSQSAKKNLNWMDLFCSFCSR